MTRPYSPTDPSSVYHRHRCTTTRHWVANQPILRIRQTGYQHRHRHITGRHEKGSKYSAEFIFPKSRYGTIKDIWKKKVPKDSSVLSDSLFASRMANELDRIRICKCCQGLFSQSRSFPNAPICKDFLLSLTVSPFLIIHSYIPLPLPHHSH